MCFSHKGFSIWIVYQQKCECEMKNVNALYALGLLFNIVVVTTSIAYIHVWKGKSEMSGSHTVILQNQL